MIMEAARHTYPNEFIGVLGGNKNEKIIDELIVVPAIFGRSFSVIRTHLVPFDPKMIGTVHSHPTESDYPSKQDINTFGKLGNALIIIAKPFDIYSVNFFNSKGQRGRLKIVK